MSPCTVLVLRRQRRVIRQRRQQVIDLVGDHRGRGPEVGQRLVELRRVDGEGGVRTGDQAVVELRAVKEPQEVAEIEGRLREFERRHPGVCVRDPGRAGHRDGGLHGAGYVESFRQAVSYDSSNPVFLRGLGTALSARGDYSQAERYLELSEKFRKEPPDADWQGVTVMEAK